MIKQGCSFKREEKSIKKRQQSEVQTTPERSSNNSVTNIQQSCNDTLSEVVKIVEG